MCAERFSSYKQQKVELVPYQELPSKYPQAPEKDYAAAVVLFTPGPGDILKVIPDTEPIPLFAAYKN
jgi:hypothetical protein